MPRAACFGVLWSEAEEAALQESFKRGGFKAANAALPQRTPEAIRRRVFAKKITRKRAVWTTAEGAMLRRIWGFATMPEICAALRRKPNAIYLKAIQFGLPIGVQEGYETIIRAAKRAGYDGVTMKRILVWARVEMLPLYGAHYSHKAKKRMVATSDVDEAVADYVRTEALETAARRHGMSRPKMKAIWKRQAVEWVRSPKGEKPHMRADSADVDAAVFKDAAWRKTRMSAAEAGKRLGISREAICKWLRKHGVVRGNRREPVAVVDIDRVVALEWRTAVPRLATLVAA